MASLMSKNVDFSAKIKMELTEDDDGPPVLDRVTPSPIDQSMLEPPPTLQAEASASSEAGPSSSSAFSDLQTRIFFDSINRSLQNAQQSRTVPLAASSSLYPSFTMAQKSQSQISTTSLSSLPSLQNGEAKPPLRKIMPKPLAAKPKPPIPLTIKLAKKPKVAENRGSPSISISIKETRNPILDSLLAGSSTVAPKPQAKKRQRVVVDDDDDDQPPQLIAFTEMAPSPKRRKVDEDRPPTLEKATVPTLDDFSTNYDDDEPPQLEREAPTDMTIKEEAPVKMTAKGRKPRKNAKAATAKRATKTPESDGPPTLELCATQDLRSGSMGSSSGVSSCAEEECAVAAAATPLAPVNGAKPPTTNRRSCRLQKENTTPPPPPPPRVTPKRAAKRKNAAPPSESVKAKKPRASRAKPQPVVIPQEEQPEGKSILLQSNWLPIGVPNVDYVGNPKRGDYTIAACYPKVYHVAEKVCLRVGDSILVNAEGDDGENVGYITKIYFDPVHGMRVGIAWFYRKHQCSAIMSTANGTKHLNNYDAAERELIFYGEHSDTISCDTIQSPAHVLSFAEYNRYMAETTYDFLPESLQASVKEFVSRGEDDYPRRKFLPHDDTPIDLVYFSRKTYKAGGRGNPLKDSGPCAAFGLKRDLRQRR